MAEDIEFSDYDKISACLNYVQSHPHRIFTLKEISKQLNIDLSETQNSFIRWSGVTFERFLQYFDSEIIKDSQNHQNQLDLFEQQKSEPIPTIHAKNLPWLSVHFELMNENEYQEHFKNLHLQYAFYPTLFGQIIVASSNRGICYIAFEKDTDQAVSTLKRRYPNAQMNHQERAIQQSILPVFQKDLSAVHEIKIHIKATDFQLKVWNSLLKVPRGGLATYSQIAEDIHAPQAPRATGTAIGSNPIAYLIPCHRIIRSTGEIGKYMWGSVRKTAIIGWEMAISQK